MTDAVVVGSGPNGLAAALTLARAGLRVEVFEAHQRIGGGLRTEALFDSEVLHDICAAVHPMAAGVPVHAVTRPGGARRPPAALSRRLRAPPPGPTGRTGMA